MELSQVRWPELKTRAAMLLPAAPRAATPSHCLRLRSQLLQQKGDPVLHGAQVFTRPEVNCISCHRVKDKKGVDFLSCAHRKSATSSARTRSTKPFSNPALAIAGYEAWQPEFESGDEATGIITSETADELTIKDPKAIATRIKKSDIVKRQQLKTSIMPAGLQQNMSTQDLVDLVEYLSSLKKAAK